tara:strand:- start:390 stop:665 length:276 start_codon:yes stop_codon:yes gene_type:complete
VDKKIAIGLIVTAVTFVVGGWINRNAADQATLRNWISKVETMAIENFERVHAAEGNVQLLQIEYEALKERLKEANSDGSRALRRHEREAHK